MTSAEPQKQKRFSESIVWRSGEDGLESFYVYGLAKTSENHILAFAEGRIERRDKDPHHIVCKISRDQGASWSDNIFVVRSTNRETFNNPVPIVNRKTGEILLFYARNYDNEATELFLTTSADGGKTWAKAKNLTDLFDGNQYDWTLHLPGPGHGLQNGSGRLLIPVWHRRSLKLPAAERFYGISIIYSDDDGATWQNGGIVPLGDFQLNESRIIEMQNGELILNARSGAFVCAPRYQSHSTDGGLTWSRPEKIETLPEAFATDSSFINMKAASGETLIFIRPDDAAARKNLTAYTSTDGGASWQYETTIYAGVAGYSDAVILDDGTCGVIYGRDLLDENGDPEGNVRETVFTRVDLKRSKRAET